MSSQEEECSVNSQSQESNSVESLLENPTVVNQDRLEEEEGEENRGEEILSQPVGNSAIPFVIKIDSEDEEEEEEVNLDRVNSSDNCDPIDRISEEIEPTGEAHLAQNVPKNYCSKCQRVFSSFYRLKQHLHIHTGEKPYQCGRCGKHFRQKSNLVSHICNVHQGLKPFVCELCSSRFWYKRNFIGIFASTLV